MFYYTSWYFYVFFGTNLLARCHSASSLFSAVFVFQKSYTGNILGIRRNKSRTSYFSRHEMKSKDETEGGQDSATHPRAARARPWPRHQGVSCPSPPPDTARTPIYFPRREKPKDPINFPRNILQAAAVIDARSRGSRSSSRHPAGGLLHHHGRLQSDVWVVYLGLRVHSSSLMVISSTMCFMFRSCELPIMIKIIFV
jgi:hypothetical protein